MRRSTNQQRVSSHSWRSSLGEIAVRMCGVCASGCGPTAGGCIGCYPGAPSPKAKKTSVRFSTSKQEEQPPPEATVPCDDEPLVEQQLKYGEELINDLIDKKWPYISSWFTTQMKEHLEPELKRYITESVELTTCGLGTKPLSLRTVSTSSCFQDWLARKEDRTNIVVVGELEFRSDGEICVAVGTAYQRIAKVTLTNLVVSGLLVLELVRLQDMPPWFSGIRIHFPDAPEVDLSISAEVFVLDRFLDIDRRVKSIVLDKLRGLINSYAVLPNHFCVGFARDLDPFQLRHPVPQGVLRLEVVQSNSKPDADADLSSHGTTECKEPEQKVEPAPPPTGPVKGSWGRWFTRKTATSDDTTLDISIGTTVKRCKVGETCDFLLVDWRRQHVKIEASGAKADLSQGHIRRPITQLVGSQTVSQPADVPLDLSSVPGLPSGSLHLKAHWRPSPSLQEVSSALALPAHDSRWALGEPCSGTWLLLVDLYYATALPSAENGTEHWATVTVRHSSTGEVLAEDVSPAVAARPPSQHGLDLLRDSVGRFPASAEDVLRDEVAPDAWRQFLGRPVAGKQEGSKYASPGLIDAVWEHPFRMMLGSGETAPVMDAIRTAELLLTVWRPERGLFKEQSGSKQAPNRELGSVRFRLAELFSSDHFCQDASHALRSAQDSHDNGADSLIRFRVQARPLQRPPDLASSTAFWNQMGSWGAQRLGGRLATRVTQAFRLGTLKVEGESGSHTVPAGSLLSRQDSIDHKADAQAEECAAGEEVHEPPSDCTAVAEVNAVAEEDVDVSTHEPVPNPPLSWRQWLFGAKQAPVLPSDLERPSDLEKVVVDKPGPMIPSDLTCVSSGSAGSGIGYASPESPVITDPYGGSATGLPAHSDEAPVEYQVSDEAPVEYQVTSFGGQVFVDAVEFHPIEQDLRSDLQGEVGAQSEDPVGTVTPDTQCPDTAKSS